MSNPDELTQLIANHNRRLRLLQERRAIQGLTVDPSVIIEIEQIETELRRLGVEPAGQPEPASSPYPGLRYFDVGDAGRFFGRAALTARLVERLAGLLAENSSRRFLAIIGASGSGKSSLARAGLIPALKHPPGLSLPGSDQPPNLPTSQPPNLPTFQPSNLPTSQPPNFPTFQPSNLPTSQPSNPKHPPGSDRWPIHLMTPTAQPLETLAASLTRDAESVTATATLIDDLRQERRSLHLYARKLLAQRIDLSGLPGADRLLLLIDQFEELFTLCRSETERQAFIDNLLAATEPNTAGPVVVVITLRADFYHHCAHYAELRETLAHQQEYIGPMTPEELRQAIEEPARRAGYNLEPGLVELILQDLGGEPGALPLLGHSLFETWRRRQDWTLTLAGYTASGRVQGAIAQTAETVYQRLPPEQQAIACRIFVALTEPGEGTQDTRRRANRAELLPETEPAAAQVLQTLADARLVTIAEETVEVAHEALIRAWPTLRAWLDEDREGLRIERRLLEAAQEWLTLNHDPEALYRGLRLAQAGAWANTAAHPLHPLAREFLEASQAAAQAAEAEVKARQQRELEAAQKLAEAERERAEAEREQAEAEKARAEAERDRADTQARTGRRLRWLLAGLAALLLLAVGATIFAFWQARIATARQLAANSQVVFEQGNSHLATLLALEANTLDSQEGRRTLTELVPYGSQPLPMYLTGHREQAISVAWSPDGRHLASGSGDLGAIIIWDSQSGEQVASLTSHTFETNTVAWSPDGGRLAFDSRGDTVTIWDSQNRKQVATLTGHTNSVNSVAWSPDGSRLASGAGDGVIIIWNSQSGEQAITLTGHIFEVNSVAWSPDGHHLASGAGDETIIIWDSQSGKQVAALTGHTDAVTSVAWSPDGSRLVSGSEDGSIIIWDSQSGKQVATLTDHTDAVTSVAWSPDGEWLASGSHDETVIIWSSRSGKQVATFTDHTGWVNSVAWSPDSRHLASGSAGGAIMIWDSQSKERAAILTGHTDAVTSVAWSPDGNWLASGSQDETILIWDSQSGEQVASLAGHTDWVSSVAWSPDGRHLASGSVDGNIIIWDSQSEEQAATLTGHTDAVTSVAWSPNGSRLASGSRDGSIIIWDSRSGKRITTITGHTDAVTSVAWSPHGSRLASGLENGNIIIWDSQSETGTRTAVLGKGVGDGSIIIWNNQSQEYITTLTGHTGSVLEVVWSPDGSRLASGSWDGTLIIWDNQNGKQVASLAGHTDWVSSVTWSPDGRHLASGSGDNTIIIWDSQSREQVATLAGHTDAVVSVAWSPDGSWLASGSWDRKIYILPERFTRPPCQWLAGTNLSLAQWLVYRGWALYQPTCPNLASPRITPFASFEYLAVTWPGHLFVAGGAGVALGLVGLVAWIWWQVVRRLWKWGQDRRKPGN
jgi:WD40 repeat protein